MSDPQPYYPPGPALLYIHSDPDYLNDPVTRTITRVDMGAIPDLPIGDRDARRERKILRSLLEHAIWLLDQEEGQ